MWKEIQKEHQRENNKYRKFQVIRTSNNDSLLNQYIEEFKYVGGERYIVTLQQKFKLKQLNDSTYQVKTKDTGSLRSEDSQEWWSFLYCPIGKPDGTVILLDGNGSKRFEYRYKNEMKNGNVINGRQKMQ